jgi:hypothetical protein
VVAEFFKREVFALLLGEELISETLMKKIAGWRHSGFSVHSQVRAQTRKEAERVGKYMIRPLLSLKRLSFSEKEDQGCYRIINHLKLVFVASKPPPPLIAYQEVLMAAETSAEYFL